jgi:hypothetical protein
MKPDAAPLDGIYLLMRNILNGQEYGDEILYLGCIYTE